MNLHGEAEQGGGLRQEMPLLEPDHQLKALVASAVIKIVWVIDITAGIAATLNQTFEEKLTSFKRQFVQKSASSVESSLKKVKRDPYQFNRKSCEKQFRHQEEVLDRMEEATEALERSDTGIAKENLNQGILLVTNRMKIIKIADRSEYGWATVKEHEADDLAEDSEDERRLYRSERRAERAMLKASRSKRRSAYRSQKNQYRFQQQPPQVFSSNYKPQTNPGFKFGLCFTISVRSDVD